MKEVGQRLDSIETKQNLMNSPPSLSANEVERRMQVVEEFLLQLEALQADVTVIKSDVELQTGILEEMMTKFLEAKVASMQKNAVAIFIELQEIKRINTKHMTFPDVMDYALCALMEIVVVVFVEIATEVYTNLYPLTTTNQMKAFDVSKTAILYLFCAVLFLHHRPTLLFVLTTARVMCFIRKIFQAWDQAASTVPQSAEVKPDDENTTAKNDVPSFMSQEYRCLRAVTIEYANRLFTTTRHVISMAKMHCNVYLSFSDYVGVYQLDSSFNNKLIQRVNVRNGIDIAASYKNDCLYTVDHDGTIWKIRRPQAHTQNHDAVLWLAGCLPATTLSVTSTGNVVVIKDGTPLSCIQVLNENAEHMKTIQLPHFIVEPSHCIETPTGNYIVAYGSNSALVHGLSEIDESGQVKLRYYPLIQSHLIRKPSHVAIDQDGRLFVCDEWNNRVILLDNKLQFVQEIMSRGKESFQAPFRVSYEEKANQLLVLHGNNVHDVYRKGDKVEIFNVK